ncbi:MAG: DUF349 domain-containing protein, partial [Bacteroidota bacterium]
MENAEKLQEVSKEINNETPEEVQNNAELTDEKMKEEENKKEEETPESETQEEPTSEENVKTEEVEEEKEDKKIEPAHNETEIQVEPEGETSTEEQPPKEEIVDEKAPEPVEGEPANEEQVVVEQKDATVESSSEEPAEDEHHEEEHHDEHEEELDFHHADKPELLSKIKEVKNEDNMRLLDRVLKAVKPRFDELYELSKNEALQRFVSEGNEADSFEYHGDELDKEFFGLYGQLKSRRNKHFQDLQDQREGNLKVKERLLEDLRQIVDGEESVNSINAVRDLQTEWKKVGPVPGAYNKTLWANYNALLDRYYDNRSIYFELKDLDRKKNLELKLELCEKAEALAQHDDLKSAIMQLNELHEEY